MYTRSLCALLLLLSPILVIQFRCANPVTPEGGPKDTKPPEVVGSVPPNFSTRFNASGIRIYFNEFINLKSTGNEIILSPPQARKPAFKVRGKSILVDLKDTLVPATTYIINFGKSISDITEGNTTNDFSYVFSTGDYIDSLIISGKVLDAFDNEPVPGLFAGLYTNSIDTIPFDSLPYLVTPLYVTRTNDKGDFVFRNLRDDTFKVMILDDKSGDLVYNMPAERIAFSDSLVRPWAAPGIKPDSTGADTLAQTDMLIPATLVLRLFDEIDSTQEISKAELLRNGLFRIICKFPSRQLQVIPLNLDTAETWCMEEYSPNRDTLLLFTLSDIPDSLILEIRESREILDTVTIYPTQVTPPKRGKNEAEKPVQLGFSWNFHGNFNYLTSKLICTLSYPVPTSDPTGIILISGKDTLHPKISFTDELKRKFEVAAVWKEGTSYSLLIPDSAFISYNGISHDTVRNSFNTVSPRNLGSLFLNIDMTRQPGSYIIQLLSEKGTVLGERIVSESGKVSFLYIGPAKYRIKAILDANLNKRWDTGDYLRRKQPEMVYFFPKIIEVRGNWDVEEEWDL